MTIKSYIDPALKLCVHDKTRQVLRAPVNIELGKKLIHNKELELAPFESVTISGWSNWEQDPLGNRSWQWRLNWLSFLSYLIKVLRGRRWRNCVKI